jgi:hypothetical protein
MVLENYLKQDGFSYMVCEYHCSLKTHSPFHIFVRTIFKNLTIIHSDLKTCPEKRVMHGEYDE